MTITVVHSHTQAPEASFILSKEAWLQAQADFKVFNANPDNKPYLDETYGFKRPGKLRFTVYIFYAILRGKNPDKTTHSVASKNYTERMDALNYWASSKPVAKWTYRDEIGNISLCFPSLSVEQTKAIIRQYFDRF